MALLPRHHRLVRFCALGITVASLGYAATRARSRADVTSEGLSRLTPATQELMRGINVERPVVVHAFVSQDVPREYVEIRLRLLNLLREMEAQGGEGLTVRIVEPELYSPEAEEAMARLTGLGERAERHRAPSIERASMSLFTAVGQRMRDGAGEDEELPHKIAAILDEAAQKIERL